MSENNMQTTTPEPSQQTQAVGSLSSEPAPSVSAQVQPLGTSNTQKSWIDDLPEDIRGDETLKRFKSPADLGKSYIEARKKFGDPDKLMKIPDPADKAGWDEVYNKLGRPKEAKEYEFEFSEGFQADQTMIPKYQELMHKYGLTKEQAKGLVKDHSSITAEAMKSYNENLNKQRESDLIKLQAKIGNDIEIFNNVNEKTFNALDEKLGGRLSQKLKQHGLEHDPVILEMIYEVGRQNIEDNMRSGKGASPTTMGAADAIAEIERLKNDSNFQQARFDGDSSAQQKWAELFSRAYPENKMQKTI